MASRVNDQENRVVQIFQRKNGLKAMDTAKNKRTVLGVLDNNESSENKQSSKQPFRDLKNLNLEDFSKRDNGKKTVNSLIPVAQFEAFKVYEDRVEVKCEDKEETQELIIDDKKNTEKKESYEEANDTSIHEMSTSSIKPNHSPMSIEKSMSTVEPPSEELYFGRNLKALFFEIEEYRPEIYQHLRMKETRHRPKATYMKKQPDINPKMRTILVDWLVEVAEEYKLQSETLYLAVNFIDRFLSYMSVIRAKLQLVGTAAMFIASKFEEIIPPDVQEFVYITDDTYTARQVIRMEQLILKVLGFDLSIPTPLTFITLYAIAMRMKEKTVYLAMYISELTLLDAQPYLEYFPSEIAASSVALAQHIMDEEVWNKNFVDTTGYDLKKIQKCIEHLNESFIKAPSQPQHAIYDKYQTEKYMEVALIQPREQLINFN